MILFEFTDTAEVQGSTYVATQVVAFPDDFDVSGLPGAVVTSAPVFIDHVPR